jgi:hypothetical protein
LRSALMVARRANSGPSVVLPLKNAINSARHRRPRAPPNAGQLGPFKPSPKGHFADIRIRSSLGVSSEMINVGGTPAVKRNSITMSVLEREGVWRRDQTNYLGSSPKGGADGVGDLNSVGASILSGMKQGIDSSFLSRVFALPMRDFSYRIAHYRETELRSGSIDCALRLP